MKFIVLILACLSSLALAKEDLDRNERIFAFYSTTSVTSFTTTTITALSTCISTTTNTGSACLGRKKRVALNKMHKSLTDDEEISEELTGSQNVDDFDAMESKSLEKRSAEELGSSGARQAKRLTIWSTMFTTLTITSTSVLPSTTITASALCISPDITNGCFVG